MDYTWWIIGGSGALGFVSFLVSRIVMPCKPCQAPDFSQIQLSGESDPDMPSAWKNASYNHRNKETIFKKGNRRIIHVNRGAIAANMKSGETYPTCVVIDANGEKHQFHHLVVMGASSLGFDRDFDAANVYISTFAEVRGYIQRDQREEFVAPEPRPRKKLWRDIVRPVVKQVPIANCLMED
jgi:hypothetical protein